MTRRDPDPLQRTLLIAGVALVVALAVAFVLTALVERRVDAAPRLAFFLRLKLLLTTFTIVVLLALAAIYADIYRRMPNQFTLSLILFTVSLLLYALTANPVLPLLFGFRGSVALGPFTFIPDVFAGVAAVLLLYQSYK